jgi:uncharacterized membrane protein
MSLILVVSCILLSAFVGRYIYCKTVQGMSNRTILNPYLHDVISNSYHMLSNYLTTVDDYKGNGKEEM